MVKNEKFDLPVSDTETEGVQKGKDKVTFFSSRKVRIILAASVSGVLLLSFLIFQIVGKRRVSASDKVTDKSKPETTLELEPFNPILPAMMASPGPPISPNLIVSTGITELGSAELSKDTTTTGSKGRTIISASDLIVLNGITKNLGLPQLSKETTIEEAAWFKSIQHLEGEHAHARILSKVVQRNSFPVNKKIIADYCLNYLLTQAITEGSSFYGDVLSDFERILIKIMIENEMYNEIVDLSIRYNEKLLELMNDNFKVKDYAKFARVAKDLNYHQKMDIYYLVSKFNFEGDEIESYVIVLYSQLAAQNITLPKLDTAVAAIIFYDLVFNTEMIKNESFIGKFTDLFTSEIDNDDLLHILEIIGTSENDINRASQVLNKKAEDSSEYQISLSQFISVLAAFGKQEIIKTIDRQFFTSDLFDQCIDFLKGFSLEYITAPFLSLYELFVDKIGTDELSKSSALQEFLLENFPVSKMEISIVQTPLDSNRLKFDLLFEINHEHKELELAIKNNVDISLPLIIGSYLSKAAFKDSNVLEAVLKNLFNLFNLDPAFKFSDPSSIQFESLLMFADNDKLRELAGELNLKFDKILSYNSITKQFDQKYLPYELVSHSSVKNLISIYKPSATDKYEILEYNENDDNFEIFSIFLGISIEDRILERFPQSERGGTFSIADYLVYLSGLIYFKNGERREDIKNLHEDVKAFLIKDFPDPRAKKQQKSKPRTHTR